MAKSISNTTLLAEIRAFLHKTNAAALIVTGTDPHLNEYLCTHWQVRSWVSGFTGSAGMVLITHEKAFLFTDSRYFIQAENELHVNDFELVKAGEPAMPSFEQLIVNNLAKGQTVCIDYNCISAAGFRKWNAYLTNNSIELKPLNVDFYQLWTQRPQLPTAEIVVHEEVFAGQSSSEKIAQLKTTLKHNNTHLMLISSCDDIAWLLNLRGNDIKGVPVFMAYLTLSSRNTTLYVNVNKLTATTKAYLKQLKVDVAPYENIFNLVELSKKRIWVSSKKLNQHLFQMLKANNEIVDEALPTSLLKAVKNETEIANIAEVLVTDGVAMVKLIHGLINDYLPLSEHEIALKIMDIRAHVADYREESFDAIVGYNENGAIVHYKPHETNSAMVEKKGVLLIDCGGQYLRGTTDITRTIALSKPSKEVKEDFTLVLKGHIAIAQAVFPAGTKGYQIDVLARLALWNKGKNYGHGTGHGVGAYLNVHEGPQGISTSGAVEQALLAGMLTSNEPGFYKAGAYGIRIENLVLCIEHKNAGYLCFQTLTLCPIDKSLIDAKLLNKNEKKWLNDYHHLVYQKLKNKGLTKPEQKWLKKATSKI